MIPDWAILPLVVLLVMAAAVLESLSTETDLKNLKRDLEAYEDEHKQI